MTPKHMGFNAIHSADGDKMYPEQLITYKIRVAPGGSLKSHMHTNLTTLPVSNVGHRPSGTINTASGMQDVVEMRGEINDAIPFGVRGQLPDHLFAERRVNVIFDYRFKTLNTFDTKTKFRMQA